jgi:EAL domain-containing protein (putative c-di-GMP-specific phosphodiesterase class I)
VAEGVETAEQARLLEARGCDFCQGFHFHRPAPAHVWTGLLERAVVAANDSTLTIASPAVRDRS